MLFVTFLPSNMCFPSVEDPVYCGMPGLLRVLRPQQKFFHAKKVT
jgi:hypothetical protein